jgi:hypothetical protein
VLGVEHSIDTLLRWYKYKRRTKRNFWLNWKCTYRYK